METEVRESHRQEKKSEEIVKCGVRVIGGARGGSRERGRQAQREGEERHRKKYESEKDTQRSLFGAWNLEKREER